MILKPCDFDTFSMSLTLPIKKHIKELFKTVELLDPFGPGDLIQVVIESLDFSYPFDTTNFIAIYIDNYELAEQYPVTFSRTDFFKNQVYHLPTQPGDYVIAYDKATADSLNEEIGYEAFKTGAIIILPPIPSDLLGPEGMGRIQYGVWVQGPLTTPSEFDIEPPENSLLNVIDDDVNTYWIHHMLFKEKLPDGAISRLRLSYDGVRAINYIEIDPVAKYPFEVMGITYLDEKGVETDLRVMVEKFDRGLRLMFEEIHTRGFVFYFKLRSFEYSVYNLQDIPNLDYVARGYKTKTSKDVSQALSPDSRYFKYHDQVIGRGSDNPEIITYHQYTMGLAGIRSGNRIYEDAGVFLAPTLSADKVGMLGLEVVEIGNPLTAISDSLIQTVKLKGVFEYYIIKIDYDLESGERLGQTTIPIYPMVSEGLLEQHPQADYITERLYPAKDGIFVTTFLAHAPGMDPIAHDEEARAEHCGLSLYKNGQLLRRGKTSDNHGANRDGDWYILNNEDDELPTITTIALNKLENGVYVPVGSTLVSPKDIVPDIYEVKYRPFFRCLIPDGHIKMGVLYDISKISNLKYTYADDNTVIVPSSQGAKSIKSDLILKIIMRNDSYDQSSGQNVLHNDLTPRLSFYRLNVGRSNPQDRYNKL